MAEALKGQVAIITGSSHGIGLAIAQALASEGAALALVARSPAAVDEAAATIRATGGRAIPLSDDVSDQQVTAPIIGETVQQLGPIDLPIKNAGSASALGPIDPGIWWNDVTTNLFETCLWSRAVFPGMIPRQRDPVSVGGRRPSSRWLTWPGKRR